MTHHREVVPWGAWLGMTSLERKFCCLLPPVSQTPNESHETCVALGTTCTVTIITELPEPASLFKDQTEVFVFWFGRIHYCETNHRHYCTCVNYKNIFLLFQNSSGSLQ